MILTCKQLVRRVTDAREGRLSTVDRAGYALHLVRCRHCRRYVAQMDAVVAALHGSSSDGDAGAADAADAGSGPDADAKAPAALHAALAAAFRERKR